MVIKEEGALHFHTMPKIVVIRAVRAWYACNVQYAACHMWRVPASDRHYTCELCAIL